jgi:hypothetical protein
VPYSDKSSGGKGGGLGALISLNQRTTCQIAYRPNPIPSPSVRTNFVMTLIACSCSSSMAHSFQL